MSSSEASTDDDAFGDLQHQLPKYSRPRGVSSSFNYKPRDHEFQEWLVNRFNRSAPNGFWSVISPSIKSVLCNIQIYGPTGAIKVVISYILVHFNLHLLDAIWSALFLLFAFSCIFHRKPQFSSSLIGIYLIQVFVLYSIHMLKHFILIRSTLFTFWCFLFVVVAIWSFYSPCFIFENSFTRFSKVMSFSGKLIRQSNILLQSILILIASIAGNALAPYTAGISLWIIYKMRAISYTTFCGSSSSIPCYD